jgi:S-adenosylmethionine-diacylglycerol 3-amino-3-carboxypropyl transferase
VTGTWGAAERLALLDKLTGSLAPATVAFWSARRAAVASGVIYSGRWEKYLRAMARGGALRRRALRRLFACRTLREQESCWRASWDGPAWRLLLAIVGKRALWRYVIREPGIALVPDELDIGAYLHACFERAATNVLLGDSAFASLMLLGRYREDGPLPLHMEGTHYETVKARLDRVEPVTASLAEYLGAAGRRFDAFSLSDFSSYAPGAAYEAIWRAVERVAAPGARVCERQFLVKAAPAAQAFVRDRRLEDELGARDGALVYSFVCGEFSQGNRRLTPSDPPAILAPPISFEA